MTQRLYKSTDYLLDLIKTYGSEKIIVKFEPTITLIAKDFVIRNLGIVNMDFPFDELKKIEAAPANPMMTMNDLSVVFHRALIEYELAYVEQEYANKEDEESQLFVRTNRQWASEKLLWLTENFESIVQDPFPKDPEAICESLMTTEEQKEALKELRQYGFKKLRVSSDLYRLLVSLACQHVILSGPMKEVLEIVVANDRLKRDLGYAMRVYNSAVQQCLEEDFKKKKAKKELELTLEEYKAKVDEELKNKYSKRLTNIVNKRLNTNQPNRYIWRFVKHLLRQPSELQLVLFNFNDVSGIKRYLNLCSAVGIKVKKDTIAAVKRKLETLELDSSLFEEMVTKYNEDHSNKTISFDYDLAFADEDLSIEPDADDETVQN